MSVKSETLCDGDRNGLIRLMEAVIELYLNSGHEVLGMLHHPFIHMNDARVVTIFFKMNEPDWQTNAAADRAAEEEAREKAQEDS